MTPYEIAKTYIGTTEGPGPQNNPVVVQMYATVGQDWVEHDSVAWCAAFVGHCVERAGLRSSRKLNARSYLNWGVPIDLAEAQEGDIAIFTRGDPSGWQGHVGFFVRKTAASIEVLGGNQADAVNIKRYAKTRLLGIRRAGSVAPAVTLSVRDVQQRLRALGYHEVGVADGIMGPRTRAAILAFRQDNALTLAPIIDTALIDALETAPPREIAVERASGMPRSSRIVTAANTQIGLGTLGALGTLSSQIAPALAEAEGAQGLAHRLMALLGLDGWFPALLPWIGAAVFLAVVCAAWRARAARIEDHRSGKTP